MTKGGLVPCWVRSCEQQSLDKVYREDRKICMAEPTENRKLGVSEGTLGTGSASFLVLPGALAWEVSKGMFLYITFRRHVFGLPHRPGIAKEEAMSRT